MACVLCHRRVLHSGVSEFCGACELAWQRALLSPDGSLKCSNGPELPYPIYSHYSYRDICRDSILSCKVAGNRPLGRALAQRTARCPQLLDLAVQSDVIMPVPSSLWSRWRGAHDLAFILSDALAARSQRLLYSPPWSLQLRWQKQALRSRNERRQVFKNNQRQFDPSYFYPVIPKEKREQKLSVLIVDDIVTSANTLIQLAGQFRDLDFTFYTLASAYKAPSGVKLDIASVTCK